MMPCRRNARVSTWGYHAGVSGRQLVRIGPWLLAALIVVTACGSDPGTPAAASPSPAASTYPTPGASATDEPVPSPSAGAPAPSVAAFWSLARIALSRSRRLRIVAVGVGTRELRFEPDASGVVAAGVLSSICLTGTSYTLTGLKAATVPGKWTCGTAAMIAGFRKSGQPVYAWNSRMPADTKIRERVRLRVPGRWTWDYTATSTALGGAVRVSLEIDAVTGRLVSGLRTDPTGATRYSFSYTTIFSPIALP
jgi:hypothetical protein